MPYMYIVGKYENYLSKF